MQHSFGRGRSLAVVLGYFALLIWCALPQGLGTVLVAFPCDSQQAPGCQPQALTPLSTNADIIRLYQTADAAFIAKKVKDIGDSKDWSAITGWPLWPPGMVALQTFCYWLSPDLPIALILLLLACGLWAQVLAQIARSLYGKGCGLFTALFLPTLLLLSGEFTYYFHMGVFYTESLSTAAFLLGIGLLCKTVSDKWRKHALLAGFFLALSSYMRAQTDLVMTLTGFAFMACMAWKLWTSGERPRHQTLKKVWNANRWLACLGLALLSYHICTLPYRAAHHMQWIDMADSPMWPQTWEYKNDIPPLLQFYIDGGGVEGCTVDPELCAHIHAERAPVGHSIFTANDYFHFTIQSVAHHPWQWLMVKLPYLYDFWMQAPFESALLTLLFPVLLVCGLHGRQSGYILALMLMTTCVGIIAPLMLTHFEPRYLYQLKILILYVALAVAAGEWRKENPATSAP